MPTGAIQLSASVLPFWPFHLVQNPLRRVKRQFAPEKKGTDKVCPFPLSSHLPCLYHLGQLPPLSPFHSPPSFPVTKGGMGWELFSSSLAKYHDLFFISSLYYLPFIIFPYFLVLCNYILGHQTVKQGLLLKAFIISFSIVSSNASSGFRLTFFLFTTS